MEAPNTNPPVCYIWRDTGKLCRDCKFVGYSKCAYTILAEMKHRKEAKPS